MKLFGKLRYAFIFIPQKAVNGIDVVETFYNYITNVTKYKMYKFYFIQKYIIHISKVLKKSFVFRLSRISLFAHPSSNYFGFHINSDNYHEKIISPNWWIEANSQPYQLAYIQVCDGARILKYGKRTHRILLLLNNKSFVHKSIPAKSCCFRVHTPFTMDTYKDISWTHQFI